MIQYRFYKFWNVSIFFENMRLSERQTVHLFYILQSSNDMYRHIPGYLRVSWWTIRLSKTKRITKQFTEISFSVARKLIKNEHIQEKSYYSHKYSKLQFSWKKSKFKELLLISGFGNDRMTSECLKYSTWLIVTWFKIDFEKLEEKSLHSKVSLSVMVD